MPKKFLMKMLVVVLVFSFVLTACQSTPAAEPVVEEAPAGEEVAEEATGEEAAVAEEPAVEEAAEPSVLNIAIQVDVDTFDHQGNTTIAVANVVDYMLETLVEVEEDGTIIPNLATDWEISDDGLKYTFYLRGRCDLLRRHPLQC